MESNENSPCISGNLKTSQAVETVKRENVHTYSAVDARDAAKICCVSLSQWYGLVRQGKAPPPHPRNAWAKRMWWRVPGLIEWLRKRAVERPAQAAEINQVLDAIREETIEWKKRGVEFAKVQEARRRARAAEMTAADHEAIAMLKSLGLGDGIDFYSI